ncbi:HAD family hydrolase [Vibrio cholerae]
MKSVKRILISSDFLSTKEKEQFNNFRWLYDLISRPIFEATGIFPEKFSSSLTQEDRFSRIKFFNYSDIELDIHETQFQFAVDEIKEESFRYIKEFINHDDFLIGYEISPQTRIILNDLGIGFIDIWLHPIRYLDDILFAFNSNNDSIKRLLANESINEEIFYTYATKHKISKYKGYKRKSIEIEPNSAVFIGQTLNDKAIAKDGCMLSILDFKKELDLAIEKYSKVYYSRHPYVKSGDDKILSYLKEKGVKLTDYSAYDLLCSDDVNFVFSISSSVVHEAKYFGKNTKFLYKPIFELSNDIGFNNYSSIFQRFSFSYFWSKVLSPVTHVNDKLEPIEYLVAKDQLRDMLAFYWSYKHLDKIEMMRGQLNAVDNKVQKFRLPQVITKQKERKINLKEKLKKLNPERYIKVNDKKVDKIEIRRKIRSSEVVSFDIFDTLLVRPYNSPSELFDIINGFIPKKLKEKLVDFKEARINARDWVTEDKRNGEEVNLFERYQAIGEKFSLSESEVNYLYQLELSIEADMLYTRVEGIELFEYAKSLGKKVILVSDIFYKHDFITKLLAKNNIYGFDAIYLSSEIGLLKHTGSLFNRVIHELGIEPNKITHIGDNFIADVRNARQKGIVGIHLPQTHGVFLENSPRYYIDNSSRIVKGLVANKFYFASDSSYSNAITNGSISQFGYSVFGPMMYSFANWIKLEAEKDNIEQMLFLARDGEIVKRVYDEISENKGLYVLSSRRSLSVASLMNTSDILSLMDINFSPMELGDLLKNRWGYICDSAELNCIKNAGFKGLSDIVSFKNDRDKLELLLTSLSTSILSNAKTEREQLLKYFNSIGLDKSKKLAVVDIGHHGTLQFYLSKLLNRKISGYYFATFDKIKNLDDISLPNKGFLLDRHNIKMPHLYTKNILMFEILFLNQSGSFVCIENGTPKFLETSGEESRLEFSRQLHDGVLDFTKDYKKFEKYDNHLDINNISSIYETMLDKPHLIDSMLFSGVVFENNYSGRGFRYIVSPLHNAFDENAVWKNAEIKLKKDTPIIYRKMHKTKFDFASLIYRKAKSIYKRVAK